MPINRHIVPAGKYFHGKVRAQAGVYGLSYPSITDFRAWLRNMPSFNSRLATWHTSYMGSQTVAVNAAISQEKSDDAYLKALTYDELVEGKMTRFGAPKLLDNLMKKVQDELAKTNLQNLLKKPKLEFNDRGLGTFIYDRAAQQLSYLYEYYSPSQDRVVEPDEVEKVESQDEDEPEQFVLLADGSQVDRRVAYQENGLPKVKTEAKKVFASFEGKDQNSVSVELYITAGNHGNVDGKDFLISALAPIILSDLLGKAGIQVKIILFAGWIKNPNNGATRTTAFTTQLSKRDEVYRAWQYNWSGVDSPLIGAFITAKNYNEPLDKDVLSLLGCDPRFWRTEGFAAVQEISQQLLGAALNPSVARGPNGNELHAALKLTDPAGDKSIRFCFGRNNSFTQVLPDVREAISVIQRELATMRGVQTDSLTTAYGK